MARSPGEAIAYKMHRIGVEVTGASKTSMQRAGRKVQQRIEEEIRAVAPGMRLSGVGTKGAKVGVLLSVSSTGPNAVAYVRAKGPLHLLENDTDPHFIDPKVRSAGEALVLVDGGIRRSVHHPGTKGKQPWKKGSEVAIPQGMDILRDRMSDAVLAGFRA